MTFSEQQEKDRVISKGRLKIKDTIIFLGDTDTRAVIVKIFEAPDELPDTVVLGRLSCFGKSFHFVEMWRLLRACEMVCELQVCEFHVTFLA